jgi:ABC-type sugar transport system permease subunit
MVLVAARPLERTFVGSLTDRTFAGAVTKEVNFVGLQNYTRLLGFRIDTIDCVRNPDNSCSTQIIENTIEENSEIAVDLNSIPQLEPAALDVGIDFFTPSTLNRLITENESFKNGLATAVKAILEEGGTNR